MFITPPPPSCWFTSNSCEVSGYSFLIHIKDWNLLKWSLRYLKTYTYKIYSNHRYGRYKEGFKKSPVGLWFL